MTAAPPSWRRAGRIDPGRFERVRARPVRGWLARSLDPALRAELIEDPDRPLERGEVLKDDRAARVVLVAGGDLVLKRFRYPDALRALRRAPRRSRARLAFLGALRLEAFGIEVPEPMGVLERRRAGVGVSSWLLSRRVPGTDGARCLTDPLLDDGGRARLVDRLVDLVLALQRARIVHGDLKATNFLVDADRVSLLDLHAVGRAALPGSAALGRDRRRFLRNLEPWPELRARAAARLGEAP